MSRHEHAMFRSRLSIVYRVSFSFSHFLFCNLISTLLLTVYLNVSMLTGSFKALASGIPQA